MEVSTKISDGDGGGEAPELRETLTEEPGAYESIDSLAGTLCGTVDPDAALVEAELRSGRTGIRKIRYIR